MRPLLVLLLFALPLAIVSQDTDLSEEVIESIENRIAYGITPSIAIGIIDENGPRYYSFGTKSIDGEPIDEHTIYEIGSISKTFTAALLAHYVEKGEMRLDDPVQGHLPRQVKMPLRNGDEITLGHLSDHTSSLPRMPSNFAPANPLNPYADYTIEQMYEFVSDVKLERDIGSEYEYSNLAQGLLGHVLELKAGMSYEELMIKLIAEPLGMHETKVVLDENMKENLALPYSNGALVENWDLPALAGAGAIRSSTYDMLKYLGAQLGLVDGPLNSAMALTQRSRHDKAGDVRVGLGWHILEGSKGDIYAHTGGTGGYLTFAGFVKETNTGVLVFTNSTAGAADIGRHLLDPESELQSSDQPVTMLLRQAIDEEGLEFAADEYRDAWNNDRDSYNFDEGEINRLGYEYMSAGNLEAAKLIFELNIETFPEAFNTYDSYGEVLLEMGEKEKGIENYKKSIELNPGNTNGKEVLQKLGVEFDVEDPEIAEEVLEKHVGVYQLAPSFSVAVTREKQQLYVQATGQPKFEIYPSSETEFYLKVVNAQIKFHRDPDGSTASMTLFQGGQEMPGNRIE